MIKERRRHARLRIPLEAEYQVAGEEGWRQGTIWTLGAGGAALLCDERLEVGTALSGLHFVVEPEGDLPEARIEVGAEVVNVDRAGESGCRSCFMVGLRFVGLEESDFELLRQFVFRRLTSAQAAPTRDEPAAAGDAPPIEIRFKLFDEFVAEVAEGLSPAGMFIRAHRPLPPGSRFAFQYQLGEDFSLFQGTAEVVWTRRRSEGPERPPGMGVRFLELDSTSRRMVRRLVDQRDAEQAAGSDGLAAAPAGAETAEAEELATAAAPPPVEAASAVATGSAEDGMEAAEGEADLAGIERLNERLGAAEAAADEARERLTRLDVEVEDLRGELREEHAARAAAEEARQVAESAAAELRTEMEQAARRAAEELVRREAEWGALESDLRERLDRSDARHGEAERLAERAEEAESDLERLRWESAEAQRESEAVEAELRAHLERQSAERADLEDRLAQADGDAAELRRRLGELEEKAARDAKIEAALREQAQELRVAPAALETRLERASERLRRLRGVAAAMTSGLGDDLDAARQLDGELARRLAEMAAAGADIEEKVGGLSAARSGLAQRLARLAAAWSELEQGLAEADEEDLDVDRPPAAEQPPAEPEAAAAPAAEPEVRAAPPAEPEAEAALPGEAAAAGAAPEPPESPVAVPTQPELEPQAPAAGQLEPSAAARLVGAARRAAARLGLARASSNGASSNGGNGASPQVDPSGDAPHAGAGAPGPNGSNGAAAIEETVRAWAAAWSEQRVEDYLSFYSHDFQPVQPAGGEAGETPQGWLPPLAGMELTLGPISHTELSPGRCAVRFEQRVASDSYARSTGRTLELVREADAWKIAAESFQEL